MKQCIKDVEHICFKLRMFSIPISEQYPETHIYCDKKSLVNNTLIIELTLNKKHSSVASNFVRWNVAASVINVSWKANREILANALTKLLSETTREYLFHKWTY